MEGSVVSGYRIVESLGGDETAVLARSVRLVDGATVLVRLPVAGPSGTPALALLEREREIMASLDLPGVARPLRLDRTTGALVLEDVGGELLAARLARGPLSTSEFIGLARALAVTIAGIHRQGIRAPQPEPAGHPRRYRARAGAHRGLLPGVAAARGRAAGASGAIVARAARLHVARADRSHESDRRLPDRPLLAGGDALPGPDRQPPLPLDRSPGARPLADRAPPAAPGRGAGGRASRPVGRRLEAPRQDAGGALPDRVRPRRRPRRVRGRARPHGIDPAFPRRVVTTCPTSC